MVENEPLERFLRLLKEKAKNIPELNGQQRILIISTISKSAEALIEEYGDPFRDLTEALGPTFANIKQVERDLERLVMEVTEQASGFTKMARDGRVYPAVKVGSAHRVVLSELPEGTVLRKEVYKSKRGETCPTCKGKKDILVERSGQVPKYQKCKTCDGKGRMYPVRGIMLEVM